MPQYTLPVEADYTEADQLFKKVIGLIADEGDINGAKMSFLNMEEDDPYLELVLPFIYLNDMNVDYLMITLPVSEEILDASLKSLAGGLGSYRLRHLSNAAGGYTEGEISDGRFARGKMTW